MYASWPFRHMPDMDMVYMTNLTKWLQEFKSDTKVTYLPV